MYELYPLLVFGLPYATIMSSQEHQKEPFKSFLDIIRFPFT